MALFLCLAAGCALQAAPARAFTLRSATNGTSKAVGPIEGWDTRVLTFHVNTDDCPDDADLLEGALDRAIELWNSAPSTGIVLKRSGTEGETASQADSRLDGGKYAGEPIIACDAEMTDTLTTDPSKPVDSKYIPAATDTNEKDSRITYGVIFVNAEDGKFASITSGNLDEEKLAIVLAHEIGHALGLGHTGEKGSLMYFDATYRTVLSLSQDDIDGIAFLYPRNELSGRGFMGCNSANAAGSPGSSVPAGSGFAELALLLAVCGGGTFLFRRRARI